LTGVGQHLRHVVEDSHGAKTTGLVVQFRAESTLDLVRFLITMQRVELLRNADLRVPAELASETRGPAK